jgi:hypothetical protein
LSFEISGQLTGEWGQENEPAECHARGIQPTIHLTLGQESEGNRPVVVHTSSCLFFCPHSSVLILLSFEIAAQLTEEWGQENEPADGSVSEAICTRKDQLGQITSMKSIAGSTGKSRLVKLEQNSLARTPALILGDALEALAIMVFVGGSDSW